MIIDIHGHIGHLEDRVCTTADLERYRAAAHVDRIVVSNLDAAAEGSGTLDLDEHDAAVATLTAHAEHRRLLPLYWVRPERLDSNIHAFAGALESEPFVGGMFAPHLNGFAADDAQLNRHLRVLADLKRTAVFWTTPDDAARPSRIYTMAQRHPSLPFVLLHATGDTHWREALDCAERAQQRRDARLYLEAGRLDQEDVAEAIAMAGEDHVLFGSDAGSAGDVHAEQVRARLKRLAEQLPAPQYAKLVGLNAERVFHLGGGSA